MQVLELLRSRVAQRQTTADQTLVAAANRLAADETVDHVAVEAALAECGKTLEQFEHMCTLARRRRQWRTSWDKRTAAAARLDKARGTAEREKAQFEKLRDAWFKRAAELDAEIHSAETIVSAADGARGELVKPSNVPGTLGVELLEAHEAVAATSSRCEQLQRKIRQERELEKSQREWAEHKAALNQTTPEGNAADHERRAASAARRAREYQTELAAATTEHATATERLESLEAAALKL